jgi:hypothetical protein
MAIVPDESRVFMGKTPLSAQNLYMSLFSNNMSVGAGAVVGSFTKAETSVSPATSYLLSSASWGGANASGTYTATQTYTGGTSPIRTLRPWVRSTATRSPPGLD